MPRDLPIGNGSMLVAFDAEYRIADFYFPRVGMENQAEAKFRFGVWCDGALHPADETPWVRTLDYLRETLVTDVLLQNDEIGLRLRCYDTVDPDANVFLRKVVVRNQRPEARDVKLFVHTDFAMHGNPIGDTVMFDPPSGALVQYKARRFVLLNASVDGRAGVTEYACSRGAMAGAAGSWDDARDGVLDMSPIAQGPVDATFAIPLHLEPSGNATAFFWICAGRSDAEVRELDARVRAETPARVLSRSGSTWYTWVHKSERDLSLLPDEIVDLYRRSLLVVATQCDRGGAVLAANDSDVQWGHNDHYSYLWTRDAAFVCDAMGRAGYPEISRRFLRLARQLIRDDGYFLNKYNPDGSMAPLWQPWLRDGRPQLPIQEDETALVVWLLAREYQRTRDLDLLRELYPSLVVPAAGFMMRFRDAATGLPLPSYDLWEERLGVFTFTCAAVSAGLRAASDLANLFNEQDRRAAWATAAGEIRDALRKHLWLEDEGRFARGLLVRAGEPELDRTVDSSLFATFWFGLFPAASAPVTATMRAVREKLAVQTDVGGFARYENDTYHRIADDPGRVPGNPWVLPALWLAEHEIASAASSEALDQALDALRWVKAHATRSLVLPEQLDPYDGQHVSVAPLTWSHAQVVSVVHAWLDARERLR